MLNKLKRLLGFREKLTYEDRVRWFIQNYYETGMEYGILLENFKDQDLNNIVWYDEIVKIPEYVDEL